MGWAAAVTIVAAYALLTAGKIGFDSRSYQWMNVAGAFGFIVNSGWHGAIPSAALNIVWVGIGVAALIRISRRGQAPASRE